MTARKPYAHAAERFASYIIDFFILLFLTAFIASVFAEQGPEEKLTIAPIAVLFEFLAMIAYGTGFWSSGWQATPGERLMNLYVIRTDGAKLTQRDALERCLLVFTPILPFFTSFLPQPIAPMMVIWLHIYWFSSILTQPERGGMHDKITHTRVIPGKPKP